MQSELHLQEKNCKQCMQIQREKRCCTVLIASYRNLFKVRKSCATSTTKLCVACENMVFMLPLCAYHVYLPPQCSNIFHTVTYTFFRPPLAIKAMRMMMMIIIIEISVTIILVSSSLTRLVPPNKLSFEPRRECAAWELRERAESSSRLN